MHALFTIQRTFINLQHYQLLIPIRISTDGNPLFVSWISDAMKGVWHEPLLARGTIVEVCI